MAGAGMVVGVLISLLLEDATVAAALSTVELCCGEAEALSALPLAKWLWLLWAV